MTNSRGYEVTGLSYHVVTDAPQIYVHGAQNCKGGLEVYFSEPLAEDTLVQVYYPDNTGNYSEEQLSKKIIPAGYEKGEISISNGDYEELRIDINFDFALKIIYAVKRDVLWLYSNTKVRVLCWLFCLRCI